MITSKKHALTLLVLALSVAAGNVFAYSGQEFAKEAKVGIEQARVIALKAHPGKITDEELERVNGGRDLRYSFDIVNGKVTLEVGVDAKTGALLEGEATR